jgi:hypothetical protein
LFVRELDTEETDVRYLRQMKHRSGLLVALFALTFAASACGPETVRVTPAPSTPAPTSAAPTPTPTPTRTATPAPTSAAPTVAPTRTATQAPGSTPAAACAPQSGGSQSVRVLLTAIRIAHNPGFDRVVFEFSPTDTPEGGGSYGIPKYSVEIASTFAGPSGIPVTVAGNAAFKVLFAFGTTDAHTRDGKPTLASSDIKPSTPLVKEVRIIEDFEATVQTAVGLDHLVCPQILTLSNPARVVLDFPTPP